MVECSHISDILMQKFEISLMQYIRQDLLHGDVQLDQGPHGDGGHRPEILLDHQVPRARLGTDHGSRWGFW